MKLYLFSTLEENPFLQLEGIRGTGKETEMKLLSENYRRKQTELELEKHEACDKELVVMLLPGPQSSRVSTGRKR